MDWTIIITAFTGLVLFLFGIQHLSKEILNAVGETFRKLLAKFTKNRVRGAFFGAGVTGVIQSSIATIVIATSLVNAGMISFTQSLGIIIGSNVGTTLTAQLVAFNLMSFAPLFLILGFLLSIFGKQKYKLIGKSIFYFGLVFFSLNLMSEALIPIKNDIQIMSWLSQLSNIFIALLVGFLITSIVQSSSVTTGIVVVLASSNMITLPQGIPLLLGANIGSTLPVIFSSWKLNLYAKRTAMAHLIFNVVGALILIPFIVPFSKLVSSIGGNVGQQVANAHTIFNIGIAIIFLIFLMPYKYLIQKIVNGKEKEILQKTRFIKENLPKRNREAISIIEKEIAYSLNIISHMFKKTNKLLQKMSNKQMNRLERYEDLNNLLNMKIEKALLKIAKRDLNLKDSKKVINLIRISNTIKNLGHNAYELGHIYKEINENKKSFSKISKRDIRELTFFLREISHLTEKVFLEKSKLKKIKFIHKKVEKSINYKYKNYLIRLKTHKKYPYNRIFVKTLSIIESSFIKVQEIFKLTKEYKKIK